MDTNPNSNGGELSQSEAAQAGDVVAMNYTGRLEDGTVFGELDRIPDDPGRELCADHVLKYMVSQGRRVCAFPLDAYLHPGSATELQEFAFWKKYHGIFPTE